MNESLFENDYLKQYQILTTLNESGGYKEELMSYEEKIFYLNY